MIRTSLLGVARLGLLPHWIWKRLPAEGTFSVLLPNGVAFKYLSIANDGIGRALFWRGLKSREPETIYIFFKLAQKSNLILDIGANTGIFTLIAGVANPSSKVISFEPVPRIYDRLLANIKLNDLEERCEARNEAVSNMVGSAKFHIPAGDTPTSASLNIGGFRGIQGSLVDVPVTTIDAVCSESQRVDLVKIDVEGFEDKVLEGMHRILTNSAPNIIVECNPDGPYRSVESILSRFGYRFFHLRKEGPVAVDAIVPDERERYRCFLCGVEGDW